MAKKNKTWCCCCNGPGWAVFFIVFGLILIARDIGLNILRSIDVLSIAVLLVGVALLVGHYTRKK